MLNSVCARLQSIAMIRARNHYYYPRREDSENKRMEEQSCPVRQKKQERQSEQQQQQQLRNSTEKRTTDQKKETNGRKETNEKKENAISKLWSRLVGKKREERDVEEREKARFSSSTTPTSRSSTTPTSCELTLCLYSKIVKWINDSLSPGDRRMFNPNPMFIFAERYGLMRNEPDEIYNDYVAYQCVVYAAADQLLSAEHINQSSFSELQAWYESLCDDTRENGCCRGMEMFCAPRAPQEEDDCDRNIRIQDWACV